MKQQKWIGGAALCVALALTAPASAQYGYGYGGWGGYDGSAALLGSDYKAAAIIQAKQQNMQAGQQQAMQQNAVVQSGIRNMASSQAASQANAIQAQQQATQDWWFQHQAQQNAQERAMRAAAGGYSPGGPGFAPTGGPPPANTDIIKWPTLLQESCFASQRATIEAPYRRNPPKPGPNGERIVISPTQEDFRKMAAAIEDMKAVLDWRLTESVDTGEYNVAKNFLDRLGEEVNKALAAS
jgi:hypothetical protein